MNRPDISSLTIKGENRTVNNVFIGDGFIAGANSIVGIDIDHIR